MSKRRGRRPTADQLTPRVLFNSREAFVGCPFFALRTPATDIFLRKKVRLLLMSLSFLLIPAAMSQPSRKSREPEPVPLFLIASVRRSHREKEHERRAVALRASLVVFLPVRRVQRLTEK